MFALRTWSWLLTSAILVTLSTSLATPSAIANEPNASVTAEDLPAKLALSLKALALAEKKFGPEHQYTLLALVYTAQTYVQLEQPASALPLQLRVVAIAEKLFGPTDSKTVTAMSHLARTHSDLAEYQKARVIQERVLGIVESSYGQLDLRTAGALNELAVTHRYLADYEMALSLHQRALAIYEIYDLTLQRVTADTLNYLALTYQELGKPAQALMFEQRALAIYEKSLGSKHFEVSKALSNLAGIYNELGQFEKAVPLLMRAIEIDETATGNESRFAVWPISNLAGTYVALGQYEKAEPLMQRVVAISEKTVGPDHPETADALFGVASIYMWHERFDEAMPLLDRTVKIYSTALGKDHPKLTSPLQTIANIYLRAERYTDTLLLQKTALAIDEKALGAYHPSVATDLSFMALTYISMKHYELAEKLFHRSFEINVNALGQEHMNTSQSWSGLAIAWYFEGRLDTAIFAAKHAVNIAQVSRERVSKIGLTEVSSYSEKLRCQYENLASWLTEAGRISEAQQVLDMLKETEHFDFIRRASDSDPRKTRIGYTRREQEWLPRYEQISSRLSALGAEQQVLEKKVNLGLTDVEQARLKQLQADLKVAQAAFTAYLNEMRTGFAKKGSARVAEVEESSEQSLKDMQATLKAMDTGAVLVRYYMTDTQVKMLVTTASVQLARDATIAPKELNSKIAAFNAALRDPKSNPLPLAQELYTALVGPIAQDLTQAGATTVMLYLDGALRYLPFGALHNGKQYLVERWRMPIFTAVAKDKLREAATPHWTAAGMGVTRPWRDFAALPAVKAELGGVVQGPPSLWASLGLSGMSSTGALPGELFLDEAFTGKSLKDVGQRPFSVVHIASHFRFSPGTEVNSALLLGDGQELTLGDIRTQGYSFKNVDLLTLSACETGLGGGRDERGREIEGFGVIAQQQGAKAVLATLWPVADQSTALLMQELYRQRQEKHLTKAEALRQAQLTVMGQKKYGHPFYWAPFILMGNWL